MKKIATIIISALIFTVGLGIMFYPTISNWLHEQNASYAISNYFEENNSKTSDEYELEFAKARAYNASLSGDVESLLDAQLDEELDIQNSDYWDTLDLVNGIMGVIEIPSINVTLPIYHGTDETVLQKGAGHLEGSALPTGDVGNNAIITGHTGLPTAMLFTDLDELELGDRFYLDILNEIFTYEIVNIFVVLPSETENLTAQSDKDLVTLVTCTPYGVNSHRLLIQGERIDEVPPTSLIGTPSEEVLASEADKTSALDNLPVLIAVASTFAVVFLVTVTVVVVRSRKNSKKTQADNDEN